MFEFVYIMLGLGILWVLNLGLADINKTLEVGLKNIAIVIHGKNKWIRT